MDFQGWLSGVAGIFPECVSGKPSCGWRVGRLSRGLSPSASPSLWPLHLPCFHSKELMLLNCGVGEDS